MFYSLESMYLLFFLTEVRQLDDAMLALVGGVLTVLRILDAFNEPHHRRHHRQHPLPLG